MNATQITPEKRLWRAVLEQAYTDAEQPPLEDASDPIERAQARGFLRADTSLDQACLKEVCDNADVPLDRVVNWARKQYPVAA